MAGVAHGLAGAAVADAGTFLSRLTRLEAGAVVRLRPASADRTALWARLPWEVLVTRSVPGALSADVTVRAADLLAVLERAGTDLPARRDELWRWPLPPGRTEVLERIPGDTVRDIGAAAEGTVRAAARHGVGGRPVGDRAVRDALLDHVAITVTTELAGGPIEVPQRLVQAVIRMGFLSRADPAPHPPPPRADPGPHPPPPRADPATDQVAVLRAGSWVGLAAAYGTAWLRPAGGLVVQRGL